MDVVSFVEHLDGASALGSASVGGDPSDEPLSSVTSRDVIEGTPNEVPRTSSTASRSVLLGRTSTRSRPSAHRTDDSEEVDGDMVRDPQTGLEGLDGLRDSGKVAHHRPTRTSGSGGR